MKTLHLPSHFHRLDDVPIFKRLRASISDILLWPFLTTSFVLGMFVILLLVALAAY